MNDNQSLELNHEELTLLAVVASRTGNLLNFADLSSLQQAFVDEVASLAQQEGKMVNSRTASLESRHCRLGTATTRQVRS